MLPVLTGVDPLNFSTFKITALHGEDILSHATGFFYVGILDGQPHHWLVTNWHVLCGRNADDPEIILSSTGLVPTHLSVDFLLKAGEPEYRGRESEALFAEVRISLYDPNGHAIWWQHRLKNEIDVAVLEPGSALDRSAFTAVNGNNQNDMAVEIGNEVFILGYPLAYSHFMNTPIWKRGSIASEPHLKVEGTKERVVIDATTRTGMSGGPVFMRAKTHYAADDGSIKAMRNATRFIGIYASRPSLRPQAEGPLEDRSAELGFFYKSSSIYDVIRDRLPGPNAMALP